MNTNKDNLNETERRVYGAIISLPKWAREQRIVELQLRKAPDWIVRAASMAHNDATELERRASEEKRLAFTATFSKPETVASEETPTERWNRKWRMINRVYLAVAVCIVAYVAHYMAANMNMRSLVTTILIVTPVAILTFPHKAYKPQMKDFFKP